MALCNTTEFLSGHALLTETVRHRSVTAGAWVQSLTDQFPPADVPPVPPVSPIPPVPPVSPVPPVPETLRKSYLFATKGT